MKGRCPRGRPRRPPGITDGDGSPVFRCRFQHVLKFIFVFRGHDDHVGDGPEIGQVEKPVVGGSVLADETAPVEGEDDVKILEAHVMEDLVEGPLEEGGVNGDDGDEPLHGEPGGEGDAVLLGDAHVEEPVREPGGVFVQARARPHGRRNGRDPGSSEASRIMVRPKISVYEGGASGLTKTAPVSRSKGPTPW